MDNTFSLGIDTKIDAINSVLNAIGSVGINSEEEIDWNIDAADADKLIDNISQKIQTNFGKGFWFNREAFHKFTPDAINGNVIVPNNTLSCLIERYRGKPTPINLRGNKLFDAEKLGYNLLPLIQSDGLIHCTLVVVLPFDELVATAKHAITDAARFWFVNDKEGDQVKMGALKTTADASYISLLSEDASQRRRNMLNNPFIASTVMKVGGYNNN